MMLPELVQIIDSSYNARLNKVVRERNTVLDYWQSGISSPKYEKLKGLEKWTLKNLLDEYALPLKSPEPPKWSTIVDRAFMPEISEITREYGLVNEYFESNIAMSKYALAKGKTRSQVEYLLKRDGLPTVIRNREDFNRYMEKKKNRKQTVETVILQKLGGQTSEDFYATQRSISDSDKVLFS